MSRQAQCGKFRFVELTQPNRNTFTALLHRGRGQRIDRERDSALFSGKLYVNAAETPTGMRIGPFARMPEPADLDFKLMERRIVEFLVPVW